MGIRVVANLDAATLETGRVQSVNDLRPRGFKPLVSGDSTVLDLFLTGASGPLNIQDYSVVRLGIGGINARPTGGSYTFESLASPLDYDHDASDLQTAVTAEVAACTVEALGSFVFKVTFTANGAQTLPTVDMTNLAPPSSVSVKRLVDGDGSTKEVWLWRIFRNPIVLTESWDNLGDDGLRGSLNMGTEGVYRLLAEAGNGVAESTIELELTDSDGDITTVFQIPVEIRGEVIGDGVPAIAAFGNYVTTSDLNGRFATANVLWVSKSGNNSTGARGRFDLPYLTVGAAQTAASSGDTIIVLPGDYSAETTLGGKDGVTYQGLDGAILPAFNVTTAITIKGRGLCQSLTCNNAGAVIDMPEMDTVASISCFDGGTLTAGNAGTSISCFGGTLTAGNAGTSIFCDGGTLTAGNAGTSISCGGGILTAGNAGTFISCGGGILTAGNVGTSISCFGGTLTAGNAGTFISCEGGIVTIRNADQSHNGTTFAPINLQSSGSLIIENSRHESTEENGAVINLSNSWSGSLKIFNSRLKATNAGTDGGTIGIKYGTGVTGSVQLDGVLIETAEDGSGTAKSIDAPSAQDVLIGSPLKVTHDVDADVTLTGGSSIINTNFKA